MTSCTKMSQCYKVVQIHWVKKLNKNVFLMKGSHAVFNHSNTFQTNVCTVLSSSILITFGVNMEEMNRSSWNEKKM